MTKTSVNKKNKVRKLLKKMSLADRLVKELLSDKQFVHDIALQLANNHQPDKASGNQTKPSKEDISSQLRRRIAKKVSKNLT